MAQRIATKASAPKRTVTTNPSAGVSRNRQAVRPDGAATLSAEERHQLIAEAAYFLAEARGFSPDSELDDWLQAEQSLDAVLAGGKSAAVQAHASGK